MIHVLLIDDEPDSIFTITNILEYNGFKVNSFKDPIYSIKSIQSQFL